MSHILQTRYPHVASTRATEQHETANGRFSFTQFCVVVVPPLSHPPPTVAICHPITDHRLILYVTLDEAVQQGFLIRWLQPPNRRDLVMYICSKQHRKSIPFHVLQRPPVFVRVTRALAVPIIIVQATNLYSTPICLESSLRISLRTNSSSSLIPQRTPLVQICVK